MIRIFEKQKYLAGIFCLVTLLVFFAFVHSNIYADETYVYKNIANGYQFDYNGLNLINDDETVKTMFKNNDVEIEIYYDNLLGKNASSLAFVNYSNSKFKNTQYVNITGRAHKNIASNPATIITWKRKKLKYVENDFEYYANIDIIKNSHEVYSIFIRSKNEFDYNHYTNRFKLISRDPNSPLKYSFIHRKEKLYWSSEAIKFYEDLVNTTHTQFGIFDPTARYLGTFVKLDYIEKETSNKFNCILEYYSLSDNLDVDYFKQIYNDGRFLEFTLQTSYNDKAQDVLYDVLDGKYDEKIDAWIKVLKELDGVVLFRLNNEMNGDWCNYNALHYQRDTKIYTDLWKYFYNKFRIADANKVLFVWNPNEISFPNFKWNHYLNYFPGSQYVDIIGATGYNTGNYYSGETWRTFKEIYDAFMPEYRTRFIDYQFIITEFGSNCYGGDKEKWLEEMFENIDDYGFKLAIYWNGTDFDVDKTPARIYRVDEDVKYLNAFKKYFEGRK